MADFEDIRPYHDDEVQPVLARIIDDDELIDLVGSLRFGRVYALLCWVLRPLLRQLMRRSIKNIHSVLDFQLVVEKYLIKVIKDTTEGLNIHGLDQFDLSQPCLFMSNHRDITLDPAFTNYAVYHSGGKTLRIAIGDNLLSKPFASGLMRLNKSFIVQRSISQPRKLLAALKKLSSYIWHSLHVDQNPIWIAHREGRAKNGWDETEPAIIKMLTIAKPRAVSFADYIRQLNIVPVSIAYEYDPCDASKARELAIKEAGQEYVKQEHEDLESIGAGISGYKGRVDLVFSQPLAGEYESAEAAAKALDESIVLSYRNHASNSYAYETLYGKDALQSARETLAAHDIALPRHGTLERERFAQRTQGLTAKENELLLMMYANPIVHQLQIIAAS